MNLCFHFVLLICIFQVLAHSPRHESKSHKVARYGVKKLKSINTSGFENRFRSLSHSEKIRTKKLKSVDLKKRNEYRVKKLAQKRRKGKKKQLKSNSYGLRGLVKNKAVNAGASKLVKQGRTRPHHRNLYKPTAKKGEFKVRQDSKKRIRPGQKKKTPRNKRILPKNGARNKNKRTGRRRGRKIGTKTMNKKPALTNQQIIAIEQKETSSTTKIVTTPRHESTLAPVKSLANKPVESKQKQDAPLTSDNVATPKYTEEIKPAVTPKTATLIHKHPAEKIDLTAKEPKKVKEEKPKNNHKTHVESKNPAKEDHIKDENPKNNQKIPVENKISTKEADRIKGNVVKSITPKPNIQAKASQVTKMSQTTTEDDFLKFFKQSENEKTTTTTQKPKEKEMTLNEYLKGIINDDEIRIYFENQIHESDIPNLCTKRRQIAQKLFDKGFDNAFFPSCEYDGSFKAKQCHNWRYSDCWCVDVKTGEKVTGPCEPKRIVFTQPLYGQKNEISDHERIKKRRKERDRLGDIQDQKALEVVRKTCHWSGKDRCIVFENLLQQAPELPKKIVEAFDGMDKARGNHGQVYQRAFDILKKLRLDSPKCPHIISSLPLLQPYMERFAESCEATDKLFWDTWAADPFRTNS